MGFKNINIFASIVGFAICLLFAPCALAQGNGGGNNGNGMGNNPPPPVPPPPPGLPIDDALPLALAVALFIGVKKKLEDSKAANA